MSCSSLLRALLVGALAATSYAAAQQNAMRHEFALEADSPAFWSLVAKDAKLAIMGSGFGFTEGPVWEPGGTVLVSDEERNELCRLVADGHHETVMKLGDPDGNTRDGEQRLIVAASVLRSIIRLTPDERSYSVLANRYRGMKLNSPNDVTLGPDGALYFTDPTLDLVKGERQETPFQGVYRLNGKGELTLLIRDLAQPNGLAFSPDGRYLYIDDTEQRTIWRYRFHHDGRVSDGILFAEEKSAGELGIPDGMKVDASGNLYVTGPGGIWVWNKERQRLGRILLPNVPANLTWGGEDRSTLIITARQFVYTLRMKTIGYLPHNESKETK
ncbi:MAG TPA: SMP-30/gluconolactonase/LRE family protein [Edaphobacter sp.]|nr:SMP-30/gluconolactonase/LRE family protein [Edaphobacter sp.]